MLLSNLAVLATAIAYGFLPAQAAPSDTGVVVRVGDRPDVEIKLSRARFAREKRQGRPWYQRTTTTATAKTTTTPARTTTTTPARTTTTSVAATSTATGDAALASAVLNEHNRFRALHAAPAMTWSEPLASAAAKWAAKCVFQHSQGAVGSYGENLAASAGGAGGVTAALQGISAWEAEAPQYTPSNPNYSHFTQMVWKASTQLGCAQQVCPPGTLFDAAYGPSYYLVCEYNPPGNVYPASNCKLA
ncbi:hypothetical protein JCM3774_005979 [Rhodotorula dairenensis]